MPYSRTNHDYGIFTPQAEANFDHTFKRKIEQHEAEMAVANQ
jgi:hypothetical protein